MVVLIDMVYHAVGGLQKDEALDLNHFLDNLENVFRNDKGLLEDARGPVVVWHRGAN